MANAANDRGQMNHHVRPRSFEQPDNVILFDKIVFISTRYDEVNIQCFQFLLQKLAEKSGPTCDYDPLIRKPIAQL